MFVTVSTLQTSRVDPCFDLFKIEKPPPKAEVSTSTHLVGPSSWVSPKDHPSSDVRLNEFSTGLFGGFKIGQICEI